MLVFLGETIWDPAPIRDVRRLLPASLLAFIASLWCCLYAYYASSSYSRRTLSYLFYSIIASLLSCLYASCSYSRSTLSYLFYSITASLCFCFQASFSFSIRFFSSLLSSFSSSLSLVSSIYWAKSSGSASIRLCSAILSLTLSCYSLIRL